VLFCMVRLLSEFQYFGEWLQGGPSLGVTQSSTLAMVAANGLAR
jgi:hypothetical protein